MLGLKAFTTRPRKLCMYIVYACFCMWMCAHVCEYARVWVSTEAQRGIKSPEAWVIVVCEQPDVGAGIWTWVQSVLNHWAISAAQRWSGFLIFSFFLFFLSFFLFLPSFLFPSLLPSYSLSFSSFFFFFEVAFLHKCNEIREPAVTASLHT